MVACFLITFKGGICVTPLACGVSDLYYIILLVEGDKAMSYFLETVTISGELQKSLSLKTCVQGTAP